MDRTKDAQVLELLQKKKIVCLEELKAALGVDVRMTIFRTLRRLEYLSSYSHRGQFYTLRQIPHFDELGLWSFHLVWFSKFGNLLATAKALVEIAEMGHTAAELENALHVEVKHTLLQLTRRGEITRQQQLTREDHQAHREAGMGLAVEVLPDEMKAAIILFFSMLDEQQRRLYAGLEAAKLGHGGDRMISELLALDAHTVAKGRRELFENSVDRGRIRKEGGGRKTVEKKPRR
jgi:hypothetical protein